MSNFEICKINSSYVISSYDDTVIKIFPKKGYEIKCLNMQNPNESMKYNPFQYFRTDNDVLALVETILDLTIGEGSFRGNMDYRVTEEELLSFTLLYLLRKQTDKSFSDVLDMLKICYMNDNCNSLDTIFSEFSKKYPNDIINHHYMSFREKPIHMQRNALVSCMTRLQLFDMPEFKKITYCDELKLEELGIKKQILFIVPCLFGYTADLLPEILCFQLKQMYDPIITDVPIHRR